MDKSYIDIYLTQLFITLGQLTAAILSSTIAVPVYSYYVARYPQLLSGVQSDNTYCSDDSSSDFSDASCQYEGQEGSTEHLGNHNQVSEPSNTQAL